MTTHHATVGDIEAPGIDLLDPGLPRRLHQTFGALRERDPVHRIDDGTWLLTRYADVAPMLKDRERCGTDIHHKAATTSSGRSARAARWRPSRRGCSSISAPRPTGVSAARSPGRSRGRRWTPR